MGRGGGKWRWRGRNMRNLIIIHLIPIQVNNNFSLQCTGTGKITTPPKRIWDKRYHLHTF
jgi:hypothetical protein